MKILGKLDLAGRMIGWAVELPESTSDINLGGQSNHKPSPILRWNSVLGRLKEKTHCEPYTLMALLTTNHVAQE